MTWSRRTIAGLASVLLAGVLLSTGDRLATTAPIRFGLIIFAATSLTLLTLRLTRTFTLKNRRVDQRLFVLLAFATIVPALLVGALGSIASWLSAASDRARSAGASYEAEARHLADELAVALERGGVPESADDAAARLRRVAAAHARRGERVTIWLSDGSWRLVAGDSIVSVVALRAWPADSSGAPAIAIVGETPYAAARVRAPNGDERVAFALVPADGPMKRAIAQRISASIDLPRYTALPSKRGGGAAGADSSAGGDRTIDLLKKSAFRGFAALPGRLWTGSEWVGTDQFVTARLPFSALVNGLWRNGLVTPVAAIPLVFLAVFCLLGIRILVVNGQTLRAIGTSITSAVGALRGGVDALRAGRLEHRIPIAGSDELWDVASGFNQAAEGLERAREAELEQARMKGDLELARRIQVRLLPAAAPVLEGLDVAGLSLPALEVGGDYYDHVPLGDGRVALVLADVSGKGVPAALLMSAFRASLLGQLDSHSDPAHALANVNRFLHRSVDPGRFVTAFLAIVDGRSGRIEYCNAGHNPPFLVGAGGAAVPLETGGLLLAMMDDARYERGEARLEPGQTLVIYSDGAVEARSAGGAMWGEDRLVAQARERSADSCATAAAAIASAIRAFEGTQGPSDDLTLLLARRNGGNGAPPSVIQRRNEGPPLDPEVGT
jgi:serine phosphatase RsbU (regulator of sigma subunit)